MLILLVSGQCGQALHYLDIRNMSISESRVFFRLGVFLKTSSPGVHFSEFTFDADVPNKQLCVYTTLQHTSNVWGSETRLFLTSRPLFHVALCDTLLCCTKDLLRAAGINLTVFLLTI